MVAYILNNANGSCELCDSDAPFLKDDGYPYLEVHHVVRLADGGPDIVSNAVAICPNCHRALHYSADRNELVDLLYQKVERLIKPL